MLSQARLLWNGELDSTGQMRIREREEACVCKHVFGGLCIRGGWSRILMAGLPAIDAPSAARRAACRVNAGFPLTYLRALYSKTLMI